MEKDVGNVENCVGWGRVAVEKPAPATAKQVCVTTYFQSTRDSVDREMNPTFRPSLSTCGAPRESAFCYKELTKVLDPSDERQVEKVPFFIFICPGVLVEP